MNKMNYTLFSGLLLTLSACQPNANERESEAGELNATNGVAKTVAAPAKTKSDATLSMHTAEITVYKSPTCGCCTGWVTYLEEEGFKVKAIDHDDVDSIKVKYGLPDAKLKSCHTAIVDGYIVEGHVPANDIERLLRERPKGITGLSAPGMPMMSPGMASRTPKDYAVLSFTQSGETEVYSQY